MTYREMTQSLDDMKIRGGNLGPDAIAEKGLEPLFVRLAMALAAYEDGYLDAGGSPDRLASRQMDEAYVVEVNHLKALVGESDGQA
jgi:hypothetical protein